jgi:hypothetical protein
MSKIRISAEVKGADRAVRRMALLAARVDSVDRLERCQ